MPSASLKNRLARLEAAQRVANDDAYWDAVRDHMGPFMEAFGQAVRGEITLEQWEEWQDAHPHPERGRPPTAEEERQAEQAWSEFWTKIEQTRERLLRADEMDLLNNPGEVKKEVDTCQKWY